MKKIKVLYYWNVVLIVLSTFLNCVIINMYVNFNVSDTGFMIVLMVSFVGYVGALFLYKSYIFYRYEVTGNDMI